MSVYRHNFRALHQRINNAVILKVKTKQYSRKRTTTTTTAINPIPKPHEPPLAVRVALVSTSTAICTPVFPAIGFVNAALRIMMPDPQLRQKISASAGTILNVAFWYILPFSYDVAPILLPFAIGNGIVAGTAYGCLDILSGGPQSKILKNPLITGGGIGAFTGVVAPTLVYGQVYSAMYGIEGISEIVRQGLGLVPFALQISGATGFVAGMALYPILHYPMFGVKNVHWVNFSGVILLASGVTLYHIYSSDGEKIMPILPDGSFVTPKEKAILDSVIRFNLMKNSFETYSLSYNSWIGPPELHLKAHMISEVVRLYHKNSWGNHYTYDDQVLAFLSRWMDSGIAERYPERIVTVKDPLELIQCQKQLQKTDLIVYAILEKTNDKTTKMEKIIETLDSFGKSTSKREKRKLIRDVHSVCTAVEVLMSQRADPQNERNVQLQEEVTLWIRKRFPDILLTKDEESSQSGSLGQSIESQLNRAKWNLNKHVAVSNWEEQKKLEKQRLRNRRIMIFSGALLSLTSLIISNS